VAGFKLYVDVFHVTVCKIKFVAFLLFDYKNYNFPLTSPSEIECQVFPSAV
jgi:hypothetical protein